MLLLPTGSNNARISRLQAKGKEISSRLPIPLLYSPHRTVHMVHSSKPGPVDRESSGLVGNLGKGRDTNNGQWKNVVGRQMRKREGALKGDSFAALSTRHTARLIPPDPIQFGNKSLRSSKPIGCEDLKFWG